MRRKPKYRPPATFAQQPRIAAVLRLIGRQRGATAAEVAEHIGWRPASVRAVVVRLAHVGVEVDRSWQHGRGLVCRFVDRFTGAKDRTRLTKTKAANLARQDGLLPELRG